MTLIFKKQQSSDPSDSTNASVSTQHVSWNHALKEGWKLAISHLAHPWYLPWTFGVLWYHRVYLWLVGDWKEADLILDSQRRFSNPPTFKYGTKANADADAMPFSVLMTLNRIEIIGKTKGWDTKVDAYNGSYNGLLWSPYTWIV